MLIGSVAASYGLQIPTASLQLDEASRERLGGGLVSALPHPGVDAQVARRRLYLASMAAKSRLEGGAQGAGTAHNDAFLRRDVALPLVGDDVVERGPRFHQP
jgi:hypothetical protein